MGTYVVRERQVQHAQRMVEQGKTVQLHDHREGDECIATCTMLRPETETA